MMAMTLLYWGWRTHECEEESKRFLRYSPTNRPLTAQETGLKVCVDRYRGCASRESEMNTSDGGENGVVHQVSKWALSRRRTSEQTLVCQIFLRGENAWCKGGDGLEARMKDCDSTHTHAPHTLTGHTTQ